MNGAADERISRGEIVRSPLELAHIGFARTRPIRRASHPPMPHLRRPSVVPSARLLIVLPLVALVLVVYALVAFRWGDDVSTYWADRMAEREGVDIAHTLRTTDDLLAWIADNPKHAALYTDTLALHADTPRPTTGASFVTLLHAANRHVRAGRLGTSDRVAPHLLDRVALEPAQSPDSISIGDLIDRVSSGNAAAHDALILLLAMRGLPPAFPLLPPIQPQTGLRLTWRNHTFASPPDTLALAFAEMSPDQLDAQILTMQDGWLHDADFREAEQEWRADQPPLSPRIHRALAAATLPRTSARVLTSALASGDALWFSEPGFTTAAVYCGEHKATVVLSDVPLGLWRALDESRLPMELAQRGCPVR